MMPPVQFGSTIRIVSTPEFDERFNARDMEENGMFADNPFRPQDRVRMKVAGMTKGAFECNAGGFQNGDKVTLFHLDADKYGRSEEKVYEAMDALENDIHLLKAENPDMRALLTGGYARDENSIVLKEVLQMLFSKFRIPTFILWGSWGSNVHYDTETDTWTLSAQMMQEQTLEEVKERFSHIRIAPGDELIIETDDGDQKIDPADANINKLDD